MAGVPTQEEFFHPFPTGKADDSEIYRSWENFGEKTLEEAYEFFCTVPEIYHEDFMWMPPGGFRYYFPVIDRYLRRLGPVDDLEYTAGTILGHDIQMHFDCHEDMSGLHESILALCDYVCAHAAHYEFERTEQEELRVVWTDLRQQVADDWRGIRRPRR